MTRQLVEFDAPPGFMYGEDGQPYYNAERCDSCKFAIVFATTEGGMPDMPLSLATLRKNEAGRWVMQSHFADCVGTKRSRKKKG